MQQVLDSLDSDNPDIQLRTAIALRIRMAQPEPLNFTPEVTPYVIDCPRCGHCCPQLEQEPVLWMMPDGNTADKWALQFYGGQKGKPLYTTPQQRPWVGLTDEEIGVPTEPIQPNEAIMFARVIESLIKGKNT
jgi:hypothetical protein